MCLFKHVCCDICSTVQVTDLHLAGLSHGVGTPASVSTSHGIKFGEKQNVLWLYVTKNTFQHFNLKDQLRITCILMFCICFVRYCDVCIFWCLPWTWSRGEPAREPTSTVLQSRSPAGSSRRLRKGSRLKRQKKRMWQVMAGHGRSWQVMAGHGRSHIFPSCSSGWSRHSLSVEIQKLMVACYSVTKSAALDDWQAFQIQLQINLDDLEVRCCGFPCCTHKSFSIKTMFSQFACRLCVWCFHF